MLIASEAFQLPSGASRTTPERAGGWLASSTNKGSPNVKWMSHLNKMGKRAYRLVIVESPGDSPTDFLMVSHV